MGGDYTYYDVVEIPSIIKVEGVEYKVTGIEKKAFWGCASLTSISIPNTVTSIGYEAFYNCNNLKSASIPSSVTNIGERAFHRCYQLSSISIPNSITSIAEGTFELCSSLNSITIPNSVTSIGKNAFSGCTHLTSISIPNSIKSIEEGTFQECSNLRTVQIPNSVTSIGASAFHDCYSLTTISIPNSITEINREAFRGCSGLIAVKLPDSIKLIDTSAFYGCSSLVSISIPNSVTRINLQTFYGCSSLTSVSIPNSVTSISGHSFVNCKNLEEVICYADKAPGLGNGVFTGSFVEYATLKVPEASVEKYRAADQWKEFGKIIAISGSTPETKKCSIPSISFDKNRLIYSTETDGAEIVSNITVADAKKSYDNVVELTGVYEITAYATKSGWNDSEAATATLVWLNGSLTGTSNNSKTEVDAKPVLISSADGAINVTGLSAGDIVEVYTSDGKLVSTTTAMGVTATCIADSGINIVKIGNKRVKVVVK